MKEFELAAIAQFCFTAGGARGDGYRAIVASGSNAWYGHYGRLNGELEAGDTILMDYAPDVAYYTSDIGRMWPVNGKFSELLRLLYGYICDYHRELLKRIRPGARTEDILAGAAEIMQDRISTMSFPNERYREAVLATIPFGHLTHPVGMSVHDVGEYRDRPLVEGTVFSVDPQIIRTN